MKPHRDEIVQAIGILYIALWPMADAAGVEAPLYDCPFEQQSRQAGNHARYADELFKRETKTREPGYLLSVQSARRLLKAKKPVVLVDIRAKEEFARIRIPGSVNIPLYALQTKAFLKGKKIVLVDGGYSYARLLPTVRQLRSLGFRAVSILDGGLNAWWLAGASLAGDASARDRLLLVPPDKYFLERHYDHWRVVDIGAQNDSPRPYLFPDALRIPFKKSTKAFAKILQTALTKHPKGRQKFVLIVDEKGDNAERIATSIRGLGGGPLFVMRGGKAAYEAYLRKQAVLLNAKKRIAQGPKRQCRL